MLLPFTPAPYPKVLGTSDGHIVAISYGGIGRFKSLGASEELLNKRHQRGDVQT